MNRRDFLRHMGGIGAGAALAQFGLLGSRALAATGDYKALVCLFLTGGNDGNNTIVPIDPTGYANYSAIRGPLALPQANLVPLPELGGTSTRFGLHRGLSDWQAIWNAGQMAVLLNVGTLLKPLTLAQYQASTSDRPLDLFSHTDQQQQWQAAVSDGPSTTGWGSRLADQLAATNAGSSVPTMITTSGNNLFVTGQASRALAVPVSGSFGLSGSGTSAASLARTTALTQLLGVDKDALLVDTGQDIVTNALNYSATLNPILTSNTTPATAPFATLTSGIAKQLLAIAKIIEARTTLNATRQIFFASLGNFDTHTNQLNTQANLFAQLGPAVKAFYDAMAAIGANANVTTFTLSDFSRTFKPNTGGGTDHAWGNNHFIIGGAVRGQRFYGTQPTLALGGPDDTSQEGRWIPTTAVDQYAATLATWFGVSPGGLASVLPNLAQFPTANLGFV
jgi:uncharacterized protein (DUF1501 family)